MSTMTPTTHPTASETILAEAMSWPGVEAGPGRFGAVQLRLGKRELGHLHGDYLADLPFTRALRDELLSEGRIVPHRPMPDSGWGSRHIETEEDVHAVIELLRLQYDRAVDAQQRRAG